MRVPHRGQPVPAVLLVNKVDLLTDAEESFRIGTAGPFLLRFQYQF